MDEQKKSKLYTGRGDKGKTSLVGGKRVSKASPRLNAYGQLDELNSFIGLLRAELPSSLGQDDLLQEIQERLFTCGTHIATDTTDPELLKYCGSGLSEEDIHHLEQMIDKLDGDLPKLKQFILPAGGRAASVAHICRTVARRSERDIYAFLEAEPTAVIDPSVLQYINRLSDYFFVLGRAAARAEGDQEVVWRGSKEVF